MIGKEFSDFVILELIGEGGMGKVYLGLQKSLERQVALKIIPVNSFSSQDLLERCIREARIAASIQHPNIVSIYSVGREENFFYIAMEYIDGMSLESMIFKGPLSETVVWNIALQISRGLQRALQKQIIHRDIKPPNIMMTSQNIVKITDFGISKKLDDRSHLTQAGMIMGTPYYMSPEQASGTEVDFRADIYSLGATLYRALTGHMLFSGGTIVDILIKHRSELVIPPQEYIQSIKLETSAILGKMLQKDPNDRYLSYGDIITDITALLNGQPLTFALVPESYSVYLYDPPQKKKTIGSWLSPRVSTTKKRRIDSNFIVFVSGISPENLKKHWEKYCPSKTIRLVSSLSELKIHLTENPELLVLDSAFLGPKIIDFCDTLKNSFPETPLLILIDTHSVNTGDNVANVLIPIPYGGDEEKLMELLPQYLEKVMSRAKEINVQLLIKLADIFKWSVKICIDKGTEGEGSISFKKGGITDVNHKHLKGEPALRSLLVNGKTWFVDTDTVSEHLNTQVTFKKISNEENEFLKILIVDDDQANADCLTELLNNTGTMMAICVRNTEDAMALLNIEVFNAVISKAGEIVSGGSPFQKEIRKAFPDIYQIIISSSKVSNNISYILKDDPKSVFVGEKDGIPAIFKAIQQYQA